VNPKSTSNQSSKSCTVLQYPSRKLYIYTYTYVYTYIYTYTHTSYPIKQGIIYLGSIQFEWIFALYTHWPHPHIAHSQTRASLRPSDGTRSNIKQVYSFVSLTHGWGRLEKRPGVSLDCSPELSPGCILNFSAMARDLLQRMPQKPLCRLHGFNICTKSCGCNNWFCLEFVWTVILGGLLMVEQASD